MNKYKITPIKLVIIKDFSMAYKWIRSDTVLVFISFYGEAPILRNICMSLYITCWKIPKNIFCCTFL